MEMDLGLGLERRKGTWLALDSALFCVLGTCMALVD